MKTQNHKKYKKDILTLFENYLKNNNRVELIEGLPARVELIEGLIAIENIYKADKNTNKRLWFKFHKGDTLATLISEIDKDLMLYFDYMVNKLKLAIEKKELEIYFS